MFIVSVDHVINENGGLVTRTTPDTAYYIMNTFKKCKRPKHMAV